MNLNFLGRGSAFNTKEGNTSAYFIEDNNLFLIDCGESVFNILQENDLLNYQYNIIITHTHSDHIGSLGTLISKLFYTYQIKANIIVPLNKEHLTNLLNVLKAFGCNDSMYNIIIDKEVDNKFKAFKSIRLIETKHVKDLVSFGILFEINDGIIYYSGDTNDLELIKNIVNNNIINKLYVDTSSIDYPENVHLYINLLKEIIPEELKSKVYCMHLDSDDCFKLIDEFGFNAVECEKVKRKTK